MAITYEDLRQFTGTMVWFRHALNRAMLYTEGVQYLAEHAGAYWLLDEIAIAQRYEPNVKDQPFQVWKLKVTSSTATLTCEDQGKILVSKHIDYTDFPLPEIELWVEGDVILLPSEH
ncbi:DUF6876 family protein [Bradyrhizobium neotropicale]|uniref:DUF6876 family protein n=1 Tax=Bradyrhizobium neotropicale TaxID=1497615 RepID=UPI001AD6E702|nr:DUF6876 family protein [Bradyrhizobium neotropicale]MBO4221975.1 hypothetical protein [Bradyrhizobium neotropicale]